MKRILSTSFAVLSTSLLVSGCTTPIQAELDAEVKRLCAVDGGVKVYEQVRLPPDRFNRYGQVNFYRATQGENGLGPEYLFRETEEYYRRGNPQMSRIHMQVIRRSDNKLLGETVIYVRGGGDLPGPWHGSSFACPPFEEAGNVELFRRVFVPSAQ